MIEIKWMSGDATGYTDLLPRWWFEREDPQPGLVHDVRGPRGGQAGRAKCDVKVDDFHADLDYRPYRGLNEKRGMLLGVLRIEFTDASRKVVARTSWKDRGDDVFSGCETAISYSGDDEAPLTPLTEVTVRTYRGELAPRPGSGMPVAYHLNPECQHVRGAETRVEDEEVGSITLEMWRAVQLGWRPCGTCAKTDEVRKLHEFIRASTAQDESGPLATDREVVTKARLVQGLFRALLVQRWGGRCSVTGSTVSAALRASHIKPWRSSTDTERVDVFNGLLLVANLDALFDAGLITFDENGWLQRSPRLSEEDARSLGVTIDMRLSIADPGHAPYLAHHREEVFLRG